MLVYQRVPKQFFSSSRWTGTAGVVEVTEKVDLGNTVKGDEVPAYVLGMIDECMIVLLYILYSYTVHTIVYIYI